VIILPGGHCSTSTPSQDGVYCISQASLLAGIRCYRGSVVGSSLPAIIWIVLIYSLIRQATGLGLLIVPVAIGTNINWACLSDTAHPISVGVRFEACPCLQSVTVLICTPLEGATFLELLTVTIASGTNQLSSSWLIRSLSGFVWRLVLACDHFFDRLSLIPWDGFVWLNLTLVAVGYGFVNPSIDFPFGCHKQSVDCFGSIPFTLRSFGTPFRFLFVNHLLVASMGTSRVFV
jgi:hypothetical protein